jgi:NitT/TauT family transport system ATP-binding protein
VTVIDVDDVTVTFDSVTALENVDLSVSSGEFVTVIGPSGCGKSTLLRTIGGLQEPTNGQVRLGGRSPSVARQQGQIGYVFQQHTLLPWKTALENVTFLRGLADKPPAPMQARELLRTVGLETFADARPNELSGGMKQRVAIARALHLGADILLMDEPFGELDEITREKMGVEVRRVWRQDEKTVVFVTHSVPEAVFLADRCIVMKMNPRRVQTVFDVNLPRPRDEDVYSTSEFQRQVRHVREALHE